MNVKAKRLASCIQRELSDILMNEAHDSLLKTVTITDVDVTNDFSFAKIFFTSTSSLSKEQMVAELIEASKYLRKELASRLIARHTPELRFSYDESLEYASHIESIIDSINEE